jgi:hypothetical protein
MKRILITAAAGAAALAGAVALAAPAMASNGVTAVTHSAQHLDTTSGPLAGVLQYSPNGPVWALDNLSEHFTVIPETGPGNYSVTIDVTGSFKGFADPGANGSTLGSYGQPLTSSGPVKGTITYDVKSSTSPDPKSLLPNQDPATGLGAALSQLFDGQPTSGPQSIIVGGGDYNFSYQNGNYVQTTSGITGDVTGH